MLRVDLESLLKVVGETMTQVDPNLAPPPVAWPPSDATVVCYNVSKAFSNLVALSDVSVAFRPGVTGLLGPNGAGKSTLIRVMCGLAKPSIGKVWVAGGDPRENAQARKAISLVPQQDGIFENLTALKFVELAGKLNGMDEVHSRAMWALDQVHLTDEANRPVGEFSKGMRQRAKIAYALVSNPAVIVLDEPLNGLDPKQRKAMIQLFRELGEMGKTVIVSSHILDEVQRFGSHITVLANGRLAAEGDYKAIREKLDSQPRTILIECNSASTLGASLITSETVQGLTVSSNNELIVKTSTPNDFRFAVAKAAQTSNVRLQKIKPMDEDLESVFRYLVEGKRQ